MSSPLNPHRVVLATCARNISKHVGMFPRLLSGVRALASNVSLLIVESDSCDGTAEALARLAHREEGIEVHSLGDLRYDIDARTARIAYCRNIYLQRAQNLIGECPNSLLIVFDSDGILDSSFIANAGCHIRRSLKKLSAKSWISCSGTTAPYYYDIWALRADGWSPDDCWSAAKGLVKDHGYESELAYRLAVRARQICMSGMRELIPVNSAFNGLCIYKGSSIKHAKYVGLTDRGSAVCEHVPFHLGQSRLYPGSLHYIDPQLIIGYTPLSYRAINQQSETCWYLLNMLNQLRLSGAGRIAAVWGRAIRGLRSFGC